MEIDTVSNDHNSKDTNIHVISNLTINFHYMETVNKLKLTSFLVKSLKFQLPSLELILMSPRPSSVTMLKFHNLSKRQIDSAVKIPQPIRKANWYCCPIYLTANICIIQASKLSNQERYLYRALKEILATQIPRTSSRGAVYQIQTTSAYSLLLQFLTTNFPFGKNQMKRNTYDADRLAGDKIVPRLTLYTHKSLKKAQKICNESVFGCKDNAYPT